MFPGDLKICILTSKQWTSALQKVISLDSVFQDRLVDFPSLSSAVIGLANDLLQHVGIAKRVTTIRQCNSILFTQLYGVLTGTRVPGTGWRIASFVFVT